jgi:arsenate reductase
MAEGLARSLAPDGWTLFSAGSRPASVHPLAIQAMSEIGIDISHHRSKGLAEVPLESADIVVTLCAEEECPVANTRAARLSWPLPDPAAAASGDPLRRFRAVRDELAGRLRDFFAEPAVGL